MNVSDLLAALESDGIVLAVSGCDLQVTAQPGVVSTEKLDQIRQHKQAIVAFLREQIAPAATDTVERHDFEVEVGLPGEWGRPPAEILDTSVYCDCGKNKVLPELRSITGGVCWECHLRRDSLN